MSPRFEDFSRIISTGEGHKPGILQNNLISQSRMHTAEDVFIRDPPDTQVIGNQSQADREGA